MAVLIATRGPKYGRCNICGEEGLLTEDHTPPKGCVRVGQVVIRHIVERISAEKPNKKGRLSQNGVKYRTLCGRCNNSRLGAYLDNDLIMFVNQVAKYLQSPLQLPEIIQLKAKPQKIMRAILGHLAAQGVNRYNKGPYTEMVRDYFLDDLLPLPDSINIYYWVYPYNNQILTRDCSYLDFRVGSPVSIWFAKFFPLAFLVTWSEPLDYNFTLPNLADWRSLRIDDVVELPIPLNLNLSSHWPESPSEHSILLYGEEAIVAERLKR